MAQRFFGSQHWLAKFWTAGQWAGAGPAVVVPPSTGTAPSDNNYWDADYWPDQYWSHFYWPGDPPLRIHVSTEMPVRLAAVSEMHQTERPMSEFRREAAVVEFRDAQ